MDFKRDALNTIRNMKQRIDALENAQHEPVAIVGIGCRYPGTIQDTASFWDLLDSAGDAVTEV
ncbi:hypothetical protein DSM50_28820, partial [Salmonella enterica subsp. enterica serovar Java]|nr:hypothetical protein [Salmonella enterica subsp. enterica serovar Java]